jgi:hypothetical protein
MVMKHWILGMAVWGLLGGMAHANAPELAFEEANRLYEEGLYQEALDVYEALLATHANFTAEYNAGNAAFKLGEWGLARLHYERAKLLQPHDDNLTANLALLESRLVDKIDEVPTLGLGQWVAHLFGAGHVRGWVLFALACWLLGWALLMVRWTRTRRESRNTMASFAGVALGFGLFGMVGIRTTLEATRTPKGVVIMVDRVDVHSTPSAEGTVLFQLHEGARACILDARNGWKEIQLDNGNVGWVSDEATEDV